LAQDTAPDLDLAKAGPAQVLPGGLVTYTLTYSNQGDAVAEDVVLTDRLPLGVSYQEADPPGHLAEAGVYTWYVGSVVTGTGGTIVLTVTVASTLPTGSELVNEAEIATPITETNTANNRATLTTTVVAADLTLSKIAPATVLPGAQLTYTLAYTNRGSAPAEGVVLTERLPAGITYLDGEPPGTRVAEGLYRWELGFRPPATGGSVVVTGAVSADLTDGSLLINRAEISTATPEDDLGNNLATAATIVQTADVRVAKTAAAQVRPHQLLTYTLDYGNSGSAPAEAVRITDTLPPGLSYQGSQGPLPPPSVAGRQVVWDGGTLAPGSQGTLILTATVASTIPAGTSLVNSVELSTATPEDVRTNNAAQATTQVIPDVPYSLDLVVSPTRLVVGGETALVTTTTRDQWGNLVADGTRIDFSTTGPGSVSPASRLTVNGVATTTLTSAITSGIVQVTARVDNLTKNATVVVVPGPAADLTLEIFPAALTVGQMATASAFVQDAYSNAVANGTVVTFSTTLGTVAPPSTGTVDGWAVATVTSTRVGTATVTAAAQGVAPRSAQVYFGPDIPAKVQVTADPPAIPVDGVTTTIHAAVLDQFGNGVADGYNVNFTTTLGAIAPLQAKTRDGEARTILTSTSVSGVAIVTATRGILVGAVQVPFLPADLVITKTVSPDTAAPGQPVTYIIAYANHGAARARGVTLEEMLPSELVGLEYVSSGAAITLTPGTTYTWQVADLAQGEGGIIRITGRPDPGLEWPGSRTLFNDTLIRTQTAEDQTRDNRSGASLLVVTADVYVTKNLRTSSSPVPGGQLVYDLGYGSLGPAQVSHIRITDTLPAFTRFYGWYQVSGSGLQRITPDEAPVQVWEKTGVVSGNERIWVYLDVDPQAPGGEEALNTVEIATGTPELSYQNNLAVASVVIQGPNLGVSKFGPATIKPSQLITYQINVFSTGTTEVRDVVLTDVLPSAISYVTESATPPIPPSTGTSTTRTWSLGNLAPGNNRTIVLTGQVSPEVSAGANLANRIQISSSTPESYLEDNEHMVTTTVVPDLPYTMTLEARDAQIALDGATTVVTVTVWDRFGNRVGDGIPVTMTTTLGTITPTIGSTLQGQVTATLRSGTVAGLAQVTATTDGLAFSTSVKFAPDPPYSLTLHVTPQVLTADGASTATLIITATDRFANRVADGTTVDLTATKASPIPPQVTTQDGIATATVRAGTVAGTAVVTATAGAATGTVTLRLEPGPAEILTVTTSPSAIVADGVATATLAVTVTDRYQNLVPDGTEVRLAGVGVTVSPTRTTTVDGVAVGSVRAGTRAGQATITATAGSALSVATMPLLAGPPVTLTLTARPNVLVANGIATSTLLITVTDRYDNLANDGTQVHLVATGASVPETATTAGGVARTVLTAGTVAGTATVTATAGSAVGATTVRLDPGPAWAVLVRPASEQLPADGESTTALAIRVADRFGNLVADDTPVVLTVTLGTVEPSEVRTRDGWAFATFRAGTRAGQASILARAGDAVGGASVWLLPGPPHLVTVVADPPAIVADGASTTTLGITVTDRFANLVTDGYEVHLAASGGQVSPDVGLTQDGRVTAQFTAGTRAGLAVVTATVDSYAGIGVVELLPGPPYALGLTITPTRLAADGVATATIALTVTDRYDNLVADGTPVTLTTNLGTVVPERPTTVGGVARATYVAATDLGTAFITATVGPLRATTSVELVLGPPFAFIVSTRPSPPKVRADGVSTVTLQVLVLDRQARRVADGTVVTFTTDLGTFPTGQTYITETLDGRASAVLTAPSQPGVARVQIAAGDHVWIGEVRFLGRILLPLISKPVDYST